MISDTEHCFSNYEQHVSYSGKVKIASLLTGIPEFLLACPHASHMRLSNEQDPTKSCVIVRTEARFKC